MFAYKLSSAASGNGRTRGFFPFNNALKQGAAAILLLLIASISAAQQRAQSAGQPAQHEKRHEERRQIEQVEDKWRQAILHSDVSALDSILDEDYIATTAAGMLRTKEQTLDAFRSGKLHITSLDLSDRKYRFYGMTALVNGRAEATGTTAEGDMTGNYRYTQVYIYTVKSGWKLASFEINRIREPKEHHEHEGEMIGTLRFR
jgi:ketosteroid isomerase-like protein